MKESWENVVVIVESPEKVLEFIVSKRVGTLLCLSVYLSPCVSVSLSVCFSVPLCLFAHASQKMHVHTRIVSVSVIWNHDFGPLMTVFPIVALWHWQYLHECHALVGSHEFSV